MTKGTKRDSLVGARFEVRIRVVTTLDKTQQGPAWIRVLKFEQVRTDEKRVKIRTNRHADVDIGAGTSRVSWERDSQSIGDGRIVTKLSSSVDHILGDVTEEVAVGCVVNLDDTGVGDGDWGRHGRRALAADRRT